VNYDDYRDGDYRDEDYRLEIFRIPEWVREVAPEIAQDYQKSGLYNTMLDAHRKLYSLTVEAMSKANLRLASGDFEEAVFHASRAFDGYCRGVFVEPLRERVFEPLAEALPHAARSLTRILKSPTGFGGFADFLQIGIAATADPATIDDLWNNLSTFLNGGDRGVTWQLRDTNSHSVKQIDEAQAHAFVDKVQSLFGRLTAPIVKAVSEIDERYEAARNVIRGSAGR
jgi:hypothetical protein